MCACADALNFKYRDLKMFLLKLGSELQHLIKKFQPILKIKKNTDCISTKWNAQRYNLVNKQLIHILLNISRSKDNQTMKFGQLIECNMRNIFLEKSYIKYSGETSPRPFFW